MVTRLPYIYETMEIYHILNRGVDKRKIFLDERDYLRFIHDLFEFNDEEPADNVLYYFHKSNRPSVVRTNKRKLIVTIHAFCLMPNHYHLLLSSRRPKSISQFMHKLNKGYSRYFNEKHGRTGTLFEGRYKSIAVRKEAHFIHLPYYIHMNPLDLKMPKWRHGEIENYRRALDFLQRYRWSSHLDYLGKKNFPSVTQRDFLLDYFGGEKKYEASIKNWLREMETNKFSDLTLE